ncbi:MAG: hypothetical protein FVQ81_05240 [Candidatus Glassbacteria bacterium]|nr:hypothetical protein [Candidatus Glassbacteria bacterium]
MKWNIGIILIISLLQGLLVNTSMASKKYVVQEEKAMIVVDSVENIVNRITVRNIYHLYSIKLSPKSRYLAWKEFWRDISTCKCNIPLIEAPMILVITDLDTGVSDTICHTFDYVWSPSEDKLTFIYYEVEEDKKWGNHHSAGRSVWLYNATSGVREEISGIICHEYTSLYWSEYKNTLCVSCLSGSDRHYDPVTGQVLEAWGYYLKVSPDGKYGFYDNKEDAAEIYDLESKKKIQLIKSADSKSTADEIYAGFLEWGKLDGKTIAYVRFMYLEYVDCETGRMYKVTPPSPDIDPIADLVGFRDGRPVWAKIHGDKAELFYY